MTKARQQALALPPFSLSPEALAADRRRYDLALGIDLAVGLGLAVLFCLSLADDQRPTGRFLAAWLGLLAGAGIVIGGGVLLHRAGRVSGATTLLALMAAPACIIGFALGPFALAAAASALSNPAEFRVWAGQDLSRRLPGWGLTLGLLAPLIPASLLTRRVGRHMLGIGLALGAVAMLAFVLFGIVGGFGFRHLR